MIEIELIINNSIVFTEEKHCIIMKLVLLHRLTVLMGRVFTNGQGDLGSIPGRFIPKTLKMVLDTNFLNTQQYKVRIKGKVEQSRDRRSAIPYILM